MKVSPQAKVQNILIFTLTMALLFAKYKPIVLTAYVVLSYVTLTLFGYIRKQEMEKELERDNKNIMPQTIFFIILQVLVILILFLLTYYITVVKNVI